MTETNEIMHIADAAGRVAEMFDARATPYVEVVDALRRAQSAVSAPDIAFDGERLRVAVTADGRTMFFDTDAEALAHRAAAVVDRSLRALTGVSFPSSAIDDMVAFETAEEVAERPFWPSAPRILLRALIGLAVDGRFAAEVADYRSRRPFLREVEQEAFDFQENRIVFGKFRSERPALAA